MEPQYSLEQLDGSHREDEDARATARQLHGHDLRVIRRFDFATRHSHGCPWAPVGKARSDTPRQQDLESGLTLGVREHPSTGHALLDGSSIEGQPFAHYNDRTEAIRVRSQTRDV